MGRLESWSPSPFVVLETFTTCRIAVALLASMAGAPTGSAAQTVDLTPRSWEKGEAALYDSLTRSWSRRVPLARGTHGMVAGTMGAAAVRSGLEALKQGGTAMDAALTHAMAEIVLLGGSGVSHAGFMTMVYYEAATGKVHSMNAGWNTVRGETDPLSIPRNASGRTALVPGFMAGAEAAHRRFGKLPWAALFGPAIYFAEEGMLLDPTMGGRITSRQKVLERLPETKAVFTRADGTWYKTGDWWKQPALGRTLRRVAAEGASYMYRGEWAKKLVALVQRDGGKMTMQDLEAYQPIWAEPATTTFREYQLFTVAPPNWGGVNLLEALNLVEIADVRRLGHYTTSVEALDRLIGIARVSDIMGTSIIAMLVTPRHDLLQRYAADLDTTFAGRRTKTAARALWAKMQTPAWRELDRQTFELPQVQGLGHSDAVVAVDSRGNAAAVLHTFNASGWGNTGIMVDGVSIADVGGYQQPLLARIRPGDRLPDPTNPLIALKDGKPVLASSSVGVGLPEQTLLSIVNVLEYGLDSATAVDTGHFLRPVFAPWVARDTAVGPPGSQVIAEGEFAPAMLDSIRARGRRLSIVPQNRASGSGGGWVGIKIDPVTRKLYGAAPRFYNGWAVGY